MTMIMQGDCLEQLKELADNSIDSIVTDPPYGLAFMGKKWDYDVPSVEIWKECLRVLKPGGHLLAFGGTRTYHRLVVAIEDAGFEIRDQIQWIYGQGFPKSMDISKAIDKEAGAEREVLVEAKTRNRPNSLLDKSSTIWDTIPGVTAPATPEAQKWNGWGTALKPANEPICLARKPLSEKTVAKNVLRHGTGGMNIDAARIATTDNLNGGAYSGDGRASKDGNIMKIRGEVGEFVQPEGRFPANVIFDETAAEVLDKQAAQNVSRFFYVGKASKKDRGEGNTHPTVKPVKLMEYLVKLVTPEGGTVLDPFMGSGTTGVAAIGLGFKFVGVERDENYFEICEQRIRDTLAARKLAKAPQAEVQETA